jgi:surfactin synthase thioesterase subunit
MNLKYPQWQESLAAAILEFDAQQLPGKLEKAEDAISQRFQELASEKDNEHELRALTDGLFLIRDIKISRLV